MQLRISVLLKIGRQIKPRKIDTRAPEPTKPAADPALRELYERIAQGHALVEAEEQARRRWQGQ